MESRPEMHDRHPSCQGWKALPASLLRMKLKPLHESARLQHRSHGEIASPIMNLHRQCSEPLLIYRQLLKLNRTTTSLICSSGKAAPTCMHDLFFHPLRVLLLLSSAVRNGSVRTLAMARLLYQDGQCQALYIFLQAAGANHAGQFLKLLALATSFYRKLSAILIGASLQQTSDERTYSFALSRLPVAVQMRFQTTLQWQICSYFSVWCKAESRWRRNSTTLYLLKFLNVILHALRVHLNHLLTTHLLPTDSAFRSILIPLHRPARRAGVRRTSTPTSHRKAGVVSLQRPPTILLRIQPLVDVHLLAGQGRGVDCTRPIRAVRVRVRVCHLHRRQTRQDQYHSLRQIRQDLCHSMVSSARKSGRAHSRMHHGHGRRHRRQHLPPIPSLVYDRKLAVVRLVSCPPSRLISAIIAILQLLVRVTAPS